MYFSIFIKTKTLRLDLARLNTEPRLIFACCYRNSFVAFVQRLVVPPSFHPSKNVYVKPTSSVHTCSNNFKGRQQRTVFRVREYHRDYPKVFLVFES